MSGGNLPLAFPEARGIFSLSDEDLSDKSIISPTPAKRGAEKDRTLEEFFQIRQPIQNLRRTKREPQKKRESIFEYY